MEMMSTARNGNSRFPFTSSQWQELEHQALVYKYMISGMPIPPDLLFSIQRSLDSSARLLLHHHSPHHPIGLGWNCFPMGFGRKIPLMISQTLEIVNHKGDTVLKKAPAGSSSWG
ncbi:hypothetical protein L1887_35978 [Cichorium endivia]|nr:hypothetical protein L1887_35978 [Cichorium endivia]